MGMTRKTAEVL